MLRRIKLKLRRSIVRRGAFSRRLLIYVQRVAYRVLLYVTAIKMGNEICGNGPDPDKSIHTHRNGIGDSRCFSVVDRIY